MGSPNILVPIALAAYVVATFALISLLGARRGVTPSLLGGWLLLPSFSSSTYDLPLLHGKAMFVPAVVFLASVLLDTNRWRRWRPALLDVPIAVTCVVPWVAASTNGFGAYEAGSAVFASFVEWGVPYLLGRVYFRRPADILGCASSLVAAALLYVPLCLWEIRMSPHLQYQLYGFGTFGFGQAIRFGGYRPVVFMGDGLMLGMFMSVATLVALWLWRSRAARGVLGLSMRTACIALIVTTVLCKSTGAIVLLIIGIATLEGTRALRAPALVYALILAPMVFCAGRLAGWRPTAFVEFAAEVINQERAQSVEFRMDQEDRLIRKAMERPWFGWGRWGRSRIYDEEGRDISVTDSMWIITFGTVGGVGLLALGLALAMPAVSLSRRFPVRAWAHPAVAPTAGLAIAVLLWAMDDLLNAMMSPLYPFIMGAITSFVLARPRRRRDQHIQRANVDAMAAEELAAASAH